MENIKDNLYIRTKDFFLTGEEFSLYRNPEFGFLETADVSLERLSDYYKSEAYISHSDSSKSMADKIYQLVKRYNIAYKFSKLGYDGKPRKLLDYGCGTGDFLKYAQKKGLEVYGSEPNPDALKLAQKKLTGSNILNREIKDWQQEFDYITLWHVLEHIPDLYGFIEEMKSKLKPDGKILIAVPNHMSFDAKFYKKYWAAWDVPRHLSHFSNDSFQKLMYHFELNTVKIYPLWFDSYYVSLLSEKYKKSKFGFLRALPVGSWSNLKAVFDKNYSSVIYKVTKKPK